MRKMDEVASTVANISRTNSNRKAYIRIPVSIIKLKHLILKPHEPHETTQIQVREMHEEYAENHPNEEGKYNAYISLTPSFFD